MCSNRLAMVMKDADDEVRAVLRKDILNPRVPMHAIDTTVERYTARPGDLAQQRTMLEDEIRRLDGEIARLVCTFRPIVTT